MERRHVQSSNISEVGWESDVLEVAFKTGSVYRYTGVPERIYRDLMQSASVGKFFAAEIRGKYAMTKIRG